VSQDELNNGDLWTTTGDVLTSLGFDVLVKGIGDFIVWNLVNGVRNKCVFWEKSFGLREVWR
jgi:hypothetical protein